MNNPTHTALCGLYCRDCIPGNDRIYALVEELLREFAATGFANYAAFKAKRSAVFAEFPAAERVLREILRLKCSGSCREGPVSDLGCAVDCPIRKCVLDRKLEGCWQCGERGTCEHIKRSSAFHPGLRENLEAIAKYGMERWSEHRGRHYNWSAE